MPPQMYEFGDYTNTILRKFLENQGGPLTYAYMDDRATILRKILTNAGGVYSYMDGENTILRKLLEVTPGPHKYAYMDGNNTIWRKILENLCDGKYAYMDDTNTILRKLLECQTGGPPANILADVLLVGGGGGGGGGAGSSNGGGGGGGGYLRLSGITLIPGSYPVTVGTGGLQNVSGGDSLFDVHGPAYGGGRGGLVADNGADGGSGGGGQAPGGVKGLGTPGQGFPGGDGQGPMDFNPPYAGGGGGGGAGPGITPPPSPGPYGYGDGGPGILDNFFLVPAYVSAGGGGGASAFSAGAGGLGNAGGQGGYAPLISGQPGMGGYGMGGGGSGDAGNTNGGSGSDGVVAIRYLSAVPLATGGVITSSGGYQIHTFTTSGIFNIPTGPVVLTNFITAILARGPLRTYTEFLGCIILVEKTIEVHQIGRMCYAGNTQSQQLQIRSEANPAVALASVTINSALGTVDQFTYGTLSTPLILQAGQRYFVISDESAGDEFTDYLSTGTLAHTDVASVVSPAFFVGNAGNTQGFAETSYGFLDLKYVLSGSAFTDGFSDGFH